MFYMFNIDEVREYIARWPVCPEIESLESLPLPSVDVEQVGCFCDVLIEPDQVAVCCGHDGDPMFFFANNEECVHDLLAAALVRKIDPL